MQLPEKSLAGQRLGLFGRGGSGKSTCTALPAQVRQLADWVRRIRPDKVQVNTAVRPPAEEYAMAVPPERLALLAGLFRPRAEVIAEHRSRRVPAESPPSNRAILELLHRRPCTVEHLAQGLSLKPSEVVKSLADLEAQGRVRSVRRGAQVFYRPAAPSPAATTRSHATRAL